MPFLESIKFPLSVPALVGGRISAVPEIVSADQLLPKRREKRGEERGHEANVEQGLGSDDLWRRSGPGGSTGVCIREEGAVHGVYQDLQVGGCRLVWIRFEL